MPFLPPGIPDIPPMMGVQVPGSINPEMAKSPSPPSFDTIPSYVKMSGGEMTALAYIQSGMEMMDIAASEAPALSPLVDQVKQFVGQLLSQMAGQGQQITQTVGSDMSGISRPPSTGMTEMGGGMA